jgi:hypothetical protein
MASSSRRLEPNYHSFGWRFLVFRLLPGMAPSQRSGHRIRVARWHCCGVGAFPLFRPESVVATSRRTFLLGFAAASLAITISAKGRFTPLLNGNNLDGWTAVGDADWTVKDGMTCADKGGFSFLVSAASYRDFDLRAEFWVSHDASSGIFIRCSDRDRISATSAYEVNIFDTRSDPDYGTGAIVDVAKVFPLPQAGGRWNVMEIRARGDVFSVALNGRKTVDSARDTERADGPIALQYGAGIVNFRSVGISAL